MTVNSENSQSPAASAPLPAIPRQIGRYRIDGILGKGGFGLVYLGYDEQLTRPVAVKVPHADHISRPEEVEAYLAEARTVANLDHPNIVTVYDVGSSAEFPCYIVSKFIEGCDLSTRLKQSWLSMHETLELVATVAEALHYAHKQGLVHRDIKPGNILLDKNGKPFVADFGLALREQDVGTGPRYAGTPAYMSPEQARGEGHRVDGRSDLFSLGIVLYEMLAGRRPFKGDSQQELLEQITSFEPRPPRQYDDGTPKEVERICLKGLSKRASERYSTGKDMADDLRHFLTQQTGHITTVSGPPAASPTVQPPSTLRETPASVTPTPPTSANLPVRIVPKGLRSFDEHDADFFLELLPGARDRNGLPDSLRFWKTRIEETDADKTFAVGLIYGPSGCGKSSLVKAGLLPRLSSGVISVYFEATAEETELRLLNGLRKRCPALSGNLDLKGTMAALRRGQHLPSGKKVLIVLDQFEQWLHAKSDEENTELVQALRHCDGEHVQCIVMVRDDFWLPVSRFMQDLEIKLIEGHNSALADLFDTDHARKVLAGFGRAFGKLPEDSRETTNEQKEFLKQAVSGLAQNGKVICVRLALFAEMMRGKAWTPAGLKEVGGTAGVGVAFLEETFSAATAPPARRYHQQGARGVLKGLLPESGTDIKGHMRTYDELLAAAGYASRPKDFADLIRILDSEIRLITPTTPDGVEEGVSETEIDSSASSSSTPDARPNIRYYQLTHDYLVPSLRDWLTRKQKETRRGRAELRLAERTALWQSKPEARHLPSWWEYLSAVWLISKKNRTAIQQTMLRKAGRVHAVRWGSGLAVLLVIGIAIGNVISKERQNSLRSQVVTAVDAVQNNRGLAVPLTLKELKKLPREMVAAELKQRYPNAESHHKLGLAYALAADGDVDSEYFCSQISRAAPDEVDNLVAAFGSSREASLDAILALAKVAESEQNWRLKSRCAVVALHLGADGLASDMCQIQDRPDPIQRTMFIDTVPTWHGNVATLATYFQTRSDPALKSGVGLGIGSISPDLLADEERAAWIPVFKAWYETAPETAIHSSAGWALRHWGVELPPLSSTIQPTDRREWFVNSQGVTLLKIQPGVFERKNGSTSNVEPQTVTPTRAFYLSDCEISMVQFQRFIDDASYASEDKPEKWFDSDRWIATPDHPVQQVSWYDAVMFCNWLSLKENRVPCYERIQMKAEGQNSQNRNNEVEIDEWRLVAAGTGYRLPTDAEWEYTCRAGTTTDFSIGSDVELLRKYAVFQGSHAAINGSKLPNGWGLFDMHGNVIEWCHDWYGVYDSNGVRNPLGPREGSGRVFRGGSWSDGASSCRSGSRHGVTPDIRGDFLGFRVALSPSGQPSEAESQEIK